MDPEKRIPLVFYATPNGTEPVRDWLRSLSPTDAKIIGEDLRTVQFGWPIGMPLCRNVRPHIWEVRWNLDHRVARILFCFDDGEIVILHGFIKKTQKTPATDLDLAEARRRDLKL